jgi:hypothetical protein
VKASSSGSGCWVGDAPPTEIEQGSLWWNSSNGTLYVWYDDGDTQQWVEAGPGGGGGGGDPIVAGTGLLGGTITESGTIALDTAYTDARYVNLTGDTMTGPLVVPNATAGNQAVNLDTADSRYVNVTGDTMTGNLQVPEVHAQLFVVTDAAGVPRGFYTNRSTFNPDRTALGSEAGYALNIEATGTLGFRVDGGELAYLDPINFVVKGLSGRCDFGSFNGVFVSSKNSGFHYPLQVDALVGPVLQIDSGGAAFNRTGSWGVISDANLKTGIRYLSSTDLQGQWDDIEQLSLCKYTLTTGPEQEMLGLIAQEVRDVCPGLVEELPPTDDSGNVVEDGEPVLAIKQSVLYMKALGALQLAMARIESLETRLATLEALQ